LGLARGKIYASEGPIRLKRKQPPKKPFGGCIIYCKGLVRKEGIKRDADVQALEDVICSPS